MVKTYVKSPNSASNYTPDEIETLRKIVALNDMIMQSINKYGWEKTAVAFALAIGEEIDR